MPAEPRVVFDTNLLVSAVLLPGSVPRRALDHARLHGRVLLSMATYLELEAVLLRPKFDRYASREKRVELLDLFPSVAEWIGVSSTVTECRDPDDNKFLELATDGNADFLITGDQDLLMLAETAHLAWRFRIVTPRKFLDEVEMPG